MSRKKIFLLSLVLQRPIYQELLSNDCHGNVSIVLLKLNASALQNILKIISKPFEKHFINIIKNVLVYNIKLVSLNILNNCFIFLKHAFLLKKGVCISFLVHISYLVTIHSRKW